MVTKWERRNAFRAAVEWTSGSSYIDPSSNMSYITVYKSDGTTLISESGSRSGTGKYHYYISTQSADPLGLYIIEWKAYFLYGTPWNYLPKYEREVIQLVEVEQS